MAPESLRFAKTHEWVALEGDIATVGISDFAVKLLTDIVFLSLPSVGRTFGPGDSMGEIESVKAVSDIYAPVRGEVIEVNSSLPDNLGLLNESPFEKAWILKLKVADPSQVSQLLSWADYQKHCESGGH
ncbi:MAG: glycine cleavage system protein GcvH [Planctomycetota bacterium]